MADVIRQQQLGSVRREFAPWRDPAAEPLIRFDAVTKRFGEVAAVDGVSLDIHAREFFALLGPSGCGKTTLMRLLAGFEMPDAGRVILGGQDISAVPPHLRPVNMMFQSYALFPHMSVAANIAFGPKMEGWPRARIDARVAEMLKLVQLDGLGARKPHQLSGGQRQRVALARALARSPKVLLLDEPMAALDKKLREETQFELMHIQYELGMTFIIVTHDQEEAMTVADRIGVMDKGRLVQVGTPAEIYEQPNSRYVADFIGDVSLFEGTLEGRDGDVALVRERTSGTLLRALAGTAEAAPGATVWIAVRPEKARISPDPLPAETPNVLAGEVFDIAYLGDLSIYKVRRPDGTFMKASQPNATRLVERPIGWDDKVWLSFAPEAGVLLTR
ncbi:MAG: ABC transporter ATP-binding protein [Blastochloris sp.]|nr:ABC transporter ATP-binding protein [Blastochloris sp.]